MSQARLILFILLCVSPILLLADGLIAQGIVAGILAAALFITARNLRPGETEFLISVIRFPLAVALIPALWIVVQVLPIGVLAHPIWKSAQTALGEPVWGTISVDLGASVIALGQYLSMIAVAFLSAAVAVDRLRADWVLFGLTAAGTVIALIALTNDLVFSGAALAPFIQAQAVDCASVGAIAAAAACVRTFERYAARHSDPYQSRRLLLSTFAACSVALAICAGALWLSAGRAVVTAAGCGLFGLAFVVITRSLGLRALGMTAIAVPAIVAAILLLVVQASDPRKGLPLAFAAGPTALSERILGDAPLVGTGAGTLEAMAPIYREINEPAPGPAAATTAAALAIALGKLMLWAIVAATCVAIFVLLRASLRRGRDSFYPAMGGSCAITLLLLAFVNAGLLGTAAGLIAAATTGLGFAQSKSRVAQL